ncbi:MAG: calcium uniporter family protein [Prevotellaceae bacterium]|jgi:hypothetical protein|nr:calcium uniporter family protein [Prevotellaceae bacterium]
MNTNIQLYSYILKSNPEALKNISVDSKQFDENEICTINEFLTWNNSEKNKLLFKLVSFCIEYSLVANNSSDDMFLNALRNKHFYLDNNVIYRALGINGEIRKRRTENFLQKCVDNGQKLYISSFSKTEFSETIDYHINQLKKVPFGKINPKLFRLCYCNEGFYEFYHEWRKNRLTYGFDSFKAYLLSLYDSFLKKHKIEEDYKIPFEKNDPNIDKYKNEIADFKYDGYAISHKIDAQNAYLVEKKRENNNINIKDTKYYLITTDQKLKQWDEEHSQKQPLTLLPSHWMGLLIKYVSRTSDDFASFVSFLRLPHHDALLEENEIQSIVADISEITEDFNTQEFVMQRMIESKFENVINGQKDATTITSKAKQFSKDVLEEKYKKELLQKDSENADLESGHKTALHSQQSEFEQKRKEQDLKTKQQNFENANRQIDSIKKRKANADTEVKKQYDNKLALIIICIVLYYIALIIVTWKISWEIMEPITYFLGLGGAIGLYVFFAVKGHDFDFRKYFNDCKSEIETKTYTKYDIIISDLTELEELKSSLAHELDNNR